MVCCHGPTKIKYASCKYGRSVAKQLCNMEDTLGSLAHLEKPPNATSKIENILAISHAIAILTIISLRTSDGFWHNVAEFSKGKKQRGHFLCCVL